MHRLRREEKKEDLFKAKAFRGTCTRSGAHARLSHTPTAVVDIQCSRPAPARAVPSVTAS